MLEGDLTDFTLPDVLRLLAFTSKTGRLTVDDGRRVGRVELLDGRVRDASADAARLPLARRALGAGLVDGPSLLELLADADELPTDLEFARSLLDAGDVDVDEATLADLLREQTLDAAFDLLRWTAGSFRFVAGVAADVGGTLAPATTVDEVLEEATRRLERWDSLVRRTGALDAVVTIARPERGPGDQAEVALPADGWSLLALVDGRRTVADLVAVSGQGEYRTRRTLGALLDEGVVSVGEAEEAGPLERLLRDQAALADRERALAGDRADRTASPGPAASSAAAAGPSTVAPGPSAVAPTPAPTPAATVPEPSAAAPTATDTPAAAPGPRPVPASPPDVPSPVAAGDDTAPEAPTTAPRDGQLGGDVRRLRTKVRSDRLRTDPTVDEDLVTRLIEGVEGL